MRSQVVLYSGRYFEFVRGDADLRACLARLPRLEIVVGSWVYRFVDDAAGVS